MVGVGQICSIFEQKILLAQNKVQKIALLFRKNQVTPIARVFDQIDYFGGLTFQCFELTFSLMLMSNRNFDLQQLSHQNLPRETKKI